MPAARYLHICPNCGNEEPSERLELGLPCERCVPEKVRDRREALKILLETGRIKNLREYVEIEAMVEEVNEWFRKLFGTRLWSAQKLWARRILRRKSFAIVAPTGSGKTTFEIVMALYKVSKFGERILFILPTSLLADQVYKKLKTYAEKLGVNARIVAHHSLMRPSERKEALKRIAEGDFDILVITSMGLVSRFDELSKYKFDTIFVDDVDSFLKATSKNINRVLKLLGVPDKALEKGEELIQALKELRRLARFGYEEEKIKELREKVEKLRQEIKELVSKEKIGILVVSGALAKAKRSLRILLFREFLNFDVGGRIAYIRRIVDTYVKPKPGEDLKELTLKLVKRLGDGGLIYVPTDLGREFAAELVNYLKENGIKVGDYLSPKPDLLDKFVAGEYDVLVGLATARSPLVRGIDLPQRVKYVVFVGVPKFRFRIKIEEFTPTKYLILLYHLRDVLPKEEHEKCDYILAQLRKIANVRQEDLEKVIEAIKEGKELEGTLRYVQRIVKMAVEYVNSLMSRKEIVEKVKQSPYIALEVRDGDFVFVVPDLTTYLQASGRASRLYPGGVSKGLAVTIVDNEKAFNALVRDLSVFVEEAEMKPLEEIDLDKLMKEISEERERIKAILEGKLPPGEFKDPIKSALLIVESPTKARTIARFFGRPTIRVVNGINVYEVTTGEYTLSIVATRGHIMDLVTSARRYYGDVPDVYGVMYERGMFVPVYNTVKRCRDCGYNFNDDEDACPVCGSRNVYDAKIVVETLRELAKEVDVVFIGTDPDTEGEKIAWDVYLVVRPYVDEVKRIEFHEVTKRAIAEAIANPRDINRNMVEAQIVRRVEDRWLGFSLSRRVQEMFGKRFKGVLSAGRVQTPVLGWIIERFFKYKESRIFRFKIEFGEGEERTTIYVDIPVDSKKTAEWLADLLKEKGEVEIFDVVEEEVELPPPPPYTTDALLADASKRLKLDAPRTMKIAQDLFEMGLITYHRTDSTHVSSLGIAIAKQYIAEKFGEQEFVGRSWATREIGAHECIRPTRPIDVERLRRMISMGLIQTVKPLTRLHYEVYNLVFRRFIASQMKPAKVVRQRYKVKVLDEVVEHERVVKIIEPGFLQVYQTVTVTKPIKEGKYKIVDVTPIKAAKLYPLTQGEVVSLMRERGIGRPSTYARIIDIILKRRYALELPKTKWLVPTTKGRVVYAYLVKNFREMVSESRTRLVEKLMDSIEKGESDYQKILEILFKELVQNGLVPETATSLLRNVK